MLKYLIDFARNNNIYNITLEVDENYIPNLYIPFDWEENKNEKWSVLI